jgi:hypothetical protein
MGRDTYSESYTSRQEIVPLDESTQAGVKEKPPLPGALISNGAAYRIPRIRCADPHRLRCRRARPRAKNAPRFLYARASTEVRIHAVAA